MTLEESVEELEMLESNGISAYIDTGLKEFLAQMGRVTIDYRQNVFGTGGYTVTIGGADCAAGSCGSC